MPLHHTENPFRYVLQSPSNLPSTSPQKYIFLHNENLLSKAFCSKSLFSALIRCEIADCEIKHSSAASVKLSTRMTVKKYFTCLSIISDHVLIYTMCLFYHRAGLFYIYISTNIFLLPAFQNVTAHAFVRLPSPHCGVSDWM